MNAEDGIIAIDPRERQTGVCLRGAASSLRARTVLPFLNFPRRNVSGGPSHVRSRWDIVNDCGAMDKWRADAEQAGCPVRVTAEFRNDVCWRRRSFVRVAALP